MRDQRTENYLTKGGYTFTFVPGYSLSRINLKQALDNPARLSHSLDTQRVDTIATGLLSGDDLPAIVVFGNADGTHDELVTGAHRTAAAAKAGIKTLDAYVIIESDPFRRALLPRSINMLEGRGQTNEESLALVADVLRTFPDVTQTDIAAAFNLKPIQVSEYVRLLDYETRAEALGCGDIWARLTQTIRKELGRVSNDPVFRRTIEVLYATKINGTRAEDLVAGIRRIRSEAAALALLDKTMAAHQQSEKQAATQHFGKRAKPSVTKRWFAALNAVRRVLDPWHVDNLHLPTLDPSAIPASIALHDEVIDLCYEAKDALRAIQAQHDLLHAQTDKEQPAWPTAAPDGAAKCDGI